jgi:hypothetical protein
MEVPELPVSLSDFVPYFNREARLAVPVEQILQPFKNYEAKLREIFAQEPDSNIVSNPHVNAVPVFAGYEQLLTVHARQLEQESKQQNERYIFPLETKLRKRNGSPAVVQFLEDFKANFDIFCESSLVDMDWSNVIAAGSSVTTSLLPVPQPHALSERAHRYGSNPIQLYCTEIYL